jgi:pyruvate formate lyase activating enzyme
MAQLAKSRRIPTIAYTYSEPVVFFEYMYDCAVEANKLGVRNVMISNGYILEKPLKELCDVLAAVKVDLKSFTNEFYRKHTKGELKPVLDTLRYLARRKMWFEIVVLLIPTLNDSPKELKELCSWTAGELGPHVPVHFTRYHPTYKLRNIPPTPLRTLERAYEIGKKAGLGFVYLGNVAGHKAESTSCPGCREKLIQRYGYRIVAFNVKKGNCASCGAAVPGVWE